VLSDAYVAFAEISKVIGGEWRRTLDRSRVRFVYIQRYGSISEVVHGGEGMIVSKAIYKVSELAVRYKVSRTTVWSWIKTGKLKADRLGASYRISETDWKDFVEKGKK